MNFYEVTITFTGLPGTQETLLNTFGASQVPLTLVFYKINRVNYKHAPQQSARWKATQRVLDH